mmetsp:Transcript_13519/g.28242  ORF Transcript_13519/g.28242 Transcript_13519/m.28242 type:complete len:258 (-) Transcript_13519:8-781(-)
MECSLTRNRHRNFDPFVTTCAMVYSPRAGTVTSSAPWIFISFHNSSCAAMLSVSRAEPLQAIGPALSRTLWIWIWSVLHPARSAAISMPRRAVSDITLAVVFTNSDSLISFVLPFTKSIPFWTFSDSASSRVLPFTSWTPCLTCPDSPMALDLSLTKPMPAWTRSESLINFVVSDTLCFTLPKKAPALLGSSPVPGRDSEGDGSGASSTPLAGVGRGSLASTRPANSVAGATASASSASSNMAPTSSRRPSSQAWAN